ncbi:protease [Arsukibacterium ikkense]|uniref:Protease n=1 Tax=Arsukibacterium ikkense TaxID=336831 RepID=A0A0M2VAR7_9GAMM|nr:protease [Arsukibacterium ikkense]
MSSHAIIVTINFTPTKDVHQLCMPAWIPGSYMVRDFARNIISISARDEQGPLATQQLDKQSWQLACRQLPVTVSYHIYAYDMSVRAAYVDDELAVLNPAALCLAVSDLTAVPQQITLFKPAAQQAASWRVATALTPINGTGFLAFGTYQAADYASLIDSPILAGLFTLQQFDIDGIPHYLVVSGNNLTDLTRFASDLQQICQQQRQVFGSLPADLDQYWFLLWVTEQGYGGLEHKFSTLLLCNRFDLPANATAEPDDNYQQLLALCSHEYFHTWWVKRLKPVEFQCYRLDAEQYSSQLWLYEGFTSYFDDLALVHSGLISPQRYLSSLEKTISRVSRSPSDSVQSLAASSFNAWTKFYKQDENAVNAVVSYYAKGALLALCLEADLQQQGSSLQQLCQYLYQQYAARGTDEQSLFSSLHALGFSDLADTARAWVEQSAPLPLAAAAKKLGLALSFRSERQPDDLSGTDDNPLPAPASLSANVKLQQGLLTVTQVRNDGAAQQAGLMVGDQLLALAGRKITEQSLPQLLQRLAEHSRQDLTIYRKDRLLTLQLPIMAAPPKVAMLQVTQPEQVSRWLRQPESSLPAVAVDPAFPATS